LLAHRGDYIGKPGQKTYEPNETHRLSPTLVKYGGSEAAVLNGGAVAAEKQLICPVNFADNMVRLNHICLF